MDVWERQYPPKRITDSDDSSIVQFELHRMKDIIDEFCVYFECNKYDALSLYSIITGLQLYIRGERPADKIMVELIDKLRSYSEKLNVSEEDIQDGTDEILGRITKRNGGK